VTPREVQHRGVAVHTHRVRGPRSKRQEETTGSATNFEDDLTSPDWRGPAQQRQLRLQAGSA
jgi:hypothetical protein